MSLVVQVGAEVVGEFFFYELQRPFFGRLAVVSGQRKNVYLQSAAHVFETLHGGYFTVIVRIALGVGEDGAVAFCTQFKNRLLHIARLAEKGQFKKQALSRKGEQIARGE